MNFPESKSATLSLLFILAVASFLRFYHFNEHPLWLDELATQRYSVQNINTAAHLYGDSALELLSHKIRTATHPPLYYAFILFYTLIFGPDAPLRLPSVIFSLLSLWVFYKTARLFFDRQVSRYALILLAVHPFHIWYAQEARAYAAGCFFTLVMVYVFLRAVRTGRIAYWFYFSAACLLAVGTNFYAVFTFLAIGFSVFLKEYRKFIPRWLVACLPLLVLAVVLKAYIGDKALQIENRFWLLEPDRTVLLGTWKVFALGYSAAAWQYLAALTVFSALIIYGLDAWFREDRKTALLFLFLLFVPVFSVYLISKYLFPVYLNRHFLFVLPFYLLVLVKGVVSIPFKTERVVAAFCVPALLLAAFFHYDRAHVPTNSHQKFLMGGLTPVFDHRAIMNVLEREYQDGDMIVTAEAQGHDIVYNWVLEMYRKGYLRMPQSFLFCSPLYPFSQEDSQLTAYRLGIYRLINRLRSEKADESPSYVTFWGARPELLRQLEGKAEKSGDLLRGILGDTIPGGLQTLSPADLAIYVRDTVRDHIRDPATDDEYFSSFRNLDLPEDCSGCPPDIAVLKEQVDAMWDAVQTREQVCRVKAGILIALYPFLFQRSEDFFCYTRWAEQSEGGPYKFREAHIERAPYERVWFILTWWDKGLISPEAVATRYYFLKYYDSESVVSNDYMTLELLTRKKNKTLPGAQ